MLQAARIDSNGLLQMFEKLEDDRGRTPSALQYLSSHPLTAARIAEIQKLIADQDTARVPPPAPLLPKVDWAHLRQACSDSKSDVGHPSSGPRG
jgi:predicted Zn-dependent protease